MTKDSHSSGSDRNERARVAVVGATGYTGSELLRLLAGHPRAELCAVTSRSRAGERVSDVHPALAGVCELGIEATTDALRDAAPDLVFLALPHKVSMGLVRDEGLRRFRIIDLSGDFRLATADRYKQWYGAAHVCPEALAEAVFGLPELDRGRVREARLVANPGCYPTATILALAPLLREGLVRREGLLVDAKSGVTGAGARARETTHFPRVFGNFNAYGLLTHRHTPEMEQALSRVAGAPVSLLFTPHLLPVDRGILATCYAEPAAEVSDRTLSDLYRATYGREPFVRVTGRPPAVKDVRGSNFCDVHVTHDPRTGRILALAAIDNLVKGAAGQAVQNMNLMMGWPETAGLTQAPICP